MVRYDTMSRLQLQGIFLEPPRCVGDFFIELSLELDLHLKHLCLPSLSDRNVMSMTDMSGKFYRRDQWERWP